MFFRAVLAFLALPAVVGGLVPWLLFGNDPWKMRGTSLGWPVVLFGALVLMWCVFDFYRIGRGTLAPWDPPKKLVILGLYRFMRNPMYVGVLLVVVGQAVRTGASAVAAYAVALAAAFHARVVLGEEPALRRAFGEAYVAYAARVPRWVGRPSSRDRTP